MFFILHSPLPVRRGQFPTDRLSTITPPEVNLAGPPEPVQQQPPPLTPHMPRGNDPEDETHGTE